MKGQTKIEPCGFCGEPSVERLELTPEKREKVKGESMITKPPVMVDACAQHAQSIRDNRGWQQREYARVRRNDRAAKKRLAETQLQIEDAA